MTEQRNSAGQIIGSVINGHQIAMADPTPEQIAEWQAAADDNMKRIAAGEYDYPDPKAEKLKELEERIAALEQFLVFP